MFQDQLCHIHLCVVYRSFCVHSGMFAHILGYLSGHFPVVYFLHVVLGVACETNIDDCASNPCLNGGTCYDLVNGYSCSCRQEFVGRTCSESMCGSNNPCRNGATCHGAGRCLCARGFLGADCSIERCDLLDCQNGGSCVNGSCVCLPGVIGANCDIVQCSLMICMVRCLTVLLFSGILFFHRSLKVYLLICVIVNPCF